MHTWTTLRSWFVVGALLLAGFGHAAEPAAGAVETAPVRAPTLFIAGDSTAQAGNPLAVGWGKAFAEYFDPAKASVVNRAIGGRSSRTFVTEGRWERLVAELKAGDVVLIQFGHNDGAERNGPRIARGSLPGLGEETEAIDNQVTKQPEVVHTFGWYVRKMIAETRAKSAMPILMTITIRNLWAEGRVERSSGDYNAWIRQLAEAEKVPLIDHAKLIADHYERIGHTAANAFFPRDHVHTGEDGARLNAYFAVSGLKGLREEPLIRWLSLAGQLVPTAAPADVYVPPQPPPRGPDRSGFLAWLNLPEPADPALPNLWLIGDSTVRNGKGNGYDRQFGWGDPLREYFYPTKVNIVNRAVGGMGARTFRSQWERILPQVKRGDVVVIQFGHNDNGGGGALPGIGDETSERENPTTKQTQVVRTFGAYLREYIAEIRAKGATPVVCSLVPRNTWRDGKLARPAGAHADWARDVATSEKVGFIDLFTLLADRYDLLGQSATLALFADRTVHTNWDGAVLSAKVVADALRALPEKPVAQFLRPGM